MRIPKRYGDYKIPACPFCGKQSIIKNKEGIPTCKEHQGKTLGNLKCSCGEYLDIRQSKWGPYFHCMNCGNVQFKRGLELNNIG